ncbi:response regulator [Robertkochia solimangrovi]|uniref:response regulator n=1 Tax=Robertkochia solimangrovi TaxID=2213046 RepID=UPI00118008BC|nr:response regulator [Robertkochia solimangrovi]TRZ45291.1 hypothetical protein DMZ48_05975 [Robertkochia solimangrovi]
MAKKIILLADEDRMQATLLAFRLKNSGYKVVTAGNGKQAMEYLKEISPDLILLSNRLPYMTPDRFAERAGNIPVILIRDSREQPVNFILSEEKVSGVLWKPVEPNVCLEMIETVAFEFHIQNS